jgi:transcriptional regulator with XRE-family HTH domain
MTQAEMGRALGVSRQAVFEYEIGERRISVLVLQRLARVFRISTDQFLGFAPEPPFRKRRLSPRAMRHAERLQALSITQQRFVVRILDMLEQDNKAATARPRTGA